MKSFSLESSRVMISLLGLLSQNGELSSMFTKSGEELAPVSALAVKDDHTLDIRHFTNYHAITTLHIRLRD